MAFSNFGRKMFSYKGLTLMTAPLAVLIATGAVMGASANLSAQTSNGGNSWATASTELSLGNTNEASAMFSATDIPAGYSETRCITIKNTSPIAATIKGYGSTYESSPLSDAMTINVTQGAGGVDDGLDGAGNHCTGFTPDVSNSVVYNSSLSGYAQNDYSTGFGAKVLAPGASVSYRVTTGLPVGADVTVALAGTTASMDFIWEIQD